MLFKDVLKFFGPVEFNDDLIQSDFTLLKVNGVFHAHVDKRGWRWIEEEQYARCPAEGEHYLGQLKDDDILCDACLGNDRIAGSLDPSKRFNADILTAYEELSREPLRCNTEEIITEMNSVKYLYGLANDYIRAIEDSFDDVMQAYFILSEYNAILADELIKTSNKKLIEIHQATLGSVKAKSLFKEVVARLNIDTTQDEEVFVAVVAYKARSGFMHKDMSPMAVIFEELELECYPWLGLTMYLAGDQQDYTLAKLPLWLVKLVEEYAPQAIVSQVYKKLDEEVTNTAKILWDPKSDAVYRSFDACYAAASLV